MVGGRLREAQVMGASNRAELATDEGPRTALRAELVGPAPKPSKVFAFLAGP